YTYQRQWDKAANDLGKVVELIPNSLFHRRVHADLLMRAGDLENYRLEREQMLKRSRQNKLNQDGVGNVAIGSAQAPLPEADAADVARMAQQALGPDRRSAGRLYYLGAAYYRAGQFEKAVAALSDSLKFGPDWASNPVNWPLLAMASSRLGQA